MPHDTSKVLMGAALYSGKDVSVFDSDPATFLAGLAVRQSSTVNQLSLTSGQWVGISLGKSLSNTKKTAVARDGYKVPMLASLKRSTGVITITSYANLLTTTPDSITVGATVFAAQAGAATPGTATFRAATDNNTTATSLATQINAHATASTLVYAVASSATVTLYAVVEGAATGHDVALAYTDNGGGNIGATVSVANLAGGSNTITDIAYVVSGQKVYINNTTGKADIAMTGFSTVSDAVYIETEKTGINESDVEVAAVVVDMQGGL